MDINIITSVTTVTLKVTFKTYILCRNVCLQVYMYIMYNLVNVHANKLNTHTLYDFSI